MTRDNFDDYEDDVDLTRIEPEERTSHLKQVENPETIFPGKFQDEVNQSPVTDEMIQGDETNPESWLQYNGNLSQTGYSPADRVTADNVSDLSEAYRISTNTRGLETNPIVVPGEPPEMYLSTISGQTYTVSAVNARTGEEIWSTDYQIPEDSSAAHHDNRGVTVYQNSVFLATIDTKIVSFDRETGEKNWETSVLVDGQDQMRSFITETPLAYNGKIYFGQGGDQGGWAVVGAVDAESGELAWTTRTHDREGWVGDTWKFSSGGAWMSPSADAETNSVFFAVGNPVPAYNGIARPGPNKYTNSIVSFDADTGDINWAHQISPHELWDYDVHTTPQVFDIEVDGETRRAVSHNWKAGWRYILDAETGELLNRSEPFGQQGGEGFFSPPPLGEENAVEAAPTNLGATEWPPDTYSPRTGFHYVGSMDVASKFWRNEYTYSEDEYEWAGGGTQSNTGNTTAHVVAQDAASGQTEWEFQLPDVDESWPDALAYPGGTTATGGGVVFHGSSGGHMYALDDETGEELWSADTGARITASPVVWDDPEAGKQFVAVAASDEFVVYSAE